MKPFERLRKNMIKPNRVIILATIIGFIFVISKATVFVISNRYLRLEIDSLISSALKNHISILLVFITVIISIFLVLPVIKGSNEYINRFKRAIILAIIVGFIFGILKNTAFIVSNRYFEFKMYYLIVYMVSSIFNDYLLTTLGTAIFIFITLPIIQSFLNFMGMNKKASNIIVCGIAPFLLIFTLGGYRINKVYLPEFFGLNSIIGNIMWTLTCMLLGWLVGWAIFNISKIRLNFSPKIYSVKSSFGILSLVIFFNVACYFLPLKANRPNLLIFSVDTLRSDHLSCYGYKRKTTPNIDLLAKDGVLFTNTIAQSSWTLPSHMSLLTGLYSSSHGVMVPNNKLNNQHLTVAEILQNAGYKTVAFTDGGYLSHQFGYQGFDRFDDRGYGIETIYIKAVNWLKKNHSRPFFLFLHTYQPHCPYNPPPLYDIYSDKNYRGIVDASRKSDHYHSIKHKLTLKDYLYVIDKYDGEIYYTDHFLGKLLEELRDLGIYEKSIIVFTSDHGENFLDHPTYGIGHGQLYDEIVKVPLIIKAPIFLKNQIIGAQVESIDIMPTVLELLGISIPNKVDGDGLVELVKKGSYDKVFAFSENYNSVHETTRMIRSSDWKLLSRIWPQKKLELFNFKNDPKEKHNLFAEEVETGKFLFEKLQKWIYTQEEKVKIFPTDKIEHDDELTEKLKALGYIN